MSDVSVTSTVLRDLYIAIIIASPRATSAAATVMINTANTCPVSRKLAAFSMFSDRALGTVYRDKATAVTLTPLNMSSRDIRTAIACFFDRAPYSPIAKSIAPIIRKRSKVIFIDLSQELANPAQLRVAVQTLPRMLEQNLLVIILPMWEYH